MNEQNEISAQYGIGKWIQLIWLGNELLESVDAYQTLQTNAEGIEDPNQLPLEILEKIYSVFHNESMFFQLNNLDFISSSMIRE